MIAPTRAFLRIYAAYTRSFDPKTHDGCGKERVFFSLTCNARGSCSTPLPFHYRDGLGMGRESVLSRGAVTRSLGLLPPMVCV